jgi:hypothetical protein
MPLDPQLNPLIAGPVLLALVLIFAALWWRQADGRLQWAVLLLIGGVVVVFFLSRTALF